MAKKTDVLEDAMAEALAAVERAEKQQGADEDNDGEAALIEVDDSDVIESDEPSSSEEEPDNEELRDQLLRLAADFDNFRKRSMRQLEEARQFGAEKLLADILPVVDNLERALAHSEGESSPLVEGVRMVAKQFLDVLEAHGVVGFSSVGQPFDPERHEAMGQVPAPEQEPGTVVEEMLKGYHLHGRLLRPAQVIVAAPNNNKDE